LQALLISDLGGDAAVSSSEMAIARRACVLMVELERREVQFAQAGEADDDRLEQYSRVAGNMRRLLESLGLGRRTKDVTPPSVEQYLDHVRKQQEGEEVVEADE
jgi:hypothetical protein